MRTFLATLPTYPNSFIGREHHLSSIRLLFEQEHTRLITLLGPGGMGKTRLSVKLAQVLQAEFKDGICFVPLDAVTDYRQLTLYIGHRLGLKESFSTSWREEIVSYLVDKHLLLILDNFEQILEAAEVVAHILRHCPTVKILATSRETLGLLEEIEYPLDSLNRPNPKLFPGPKDLLKFDAIDLFVQKAKASLPNFELTPENAAAVVQICQELDGLPLPIELAAARTKLFSPEVILRKLEMNEDLLKTKAKGVAFRHQTIRNTVKWSYDLLNETEQQRFQQLCLFRSGFTFSALEAVCSGLDALDFIESFINKSLVVKGKEIHYIPRFRMLKVIRDYGLELLEQNPKKELYYDSFTEYVLSYTSEIGIQFQRSEPSKWIALLESEYENAAAALEWLIKRAPGKAGKLGINTWRFYLNRGFLREGLEMVETLLTLAIEDKMVKAKLIEGAGTLSHNLGNYLKAKDYFKRCLESWRVLENKSEIAKALNNLGWAEWRIGNYSNTISYSKNASEICLELNDQQGQARSLNNLAWALMCQGFFEKAEGLQREILYLHTQANNNRVSPSPKLT